MSKKDNKEFDKNNEKKCKKSSWTTSILYLIVVGYFIYNLIFNLNYTVDNMKEYFFYLVDSVKNLINLVR